MKFWGVSDCHFDPKIKERHFEWPRFNGFLLARTLGCRNDQDLVDCTEYIWFILDNIFQSYVDMMKQVHISNEQFPEHHGVGIIEIGWSSYWVLYWFGQKGHTHKALIGDQTVDGKWHMHCFRFEKLKAMMSVIHFWVKVTWKCPKHLWIHCGIVILYGITDIGHHRSMLWFLAWWHQPMAWNKADLSLTIINFMNQWDKKMIPCVHQGWQYKCQDCVNSYIPAATIYYYYTAAIHCWVRVLGRI